MNKTKRAKLALRAETVRSLTGAVLGKIHGGVSIAGCGETAECNTVLSLCEGYCMSDGCATQACPQSVAAPRSCANTQCMG